MVKFWRRKQLEQINLEFDRLEGHYHDRLKNYFKIDHPFEDMVNEASHLKWFLGNNATPGGIDELNDRYGDCFFFSSPSHKYFDLIKGHAFRLWSKLIEKLPPIDTHKL